MDIDVLPYGVIKAAERLGSTAKGVKGNQEAFFSEFPLPCIAHVIVEGTMLHYVVIHKITKKQVIVVSKEAFDKHIFHIALYLLGILGSFYFKWFPLGIAQVHFLAPV